MWNAFHSTARGQVEALLAVQTRKRLHNPFKSALGQRVGPCRFCVSVSWNQKTFVDFLFGGTASELCSFITALGFLPLVSIQGCVFFNHWISCSKDIQFDFPWYSDQKLRIKQRLGRLSKPLTGEWRPVYYSDAWNSSCLTQAHVKITNVFKDLIKQWMF